MNISLRILLEKCAEKRKVEGYYSMDPKNGILIVDYDVCSEIIILFLFN